MGVGPPWARWTSLSAIHPDRISPPVKLIRLCLAAPSFANQLNNNNRHSCSFLNFPKNINSTLLFQNYKEININRIVNAFLFTFQSSAHFYSYSESQTVMFLNYAYCVQQFTCLYISFLKNSGAIGKT